MSKEQFLNRIRAGANQLNTNHLEHYFKDYAGPYDDDTANEYVRFFNNDPKALAENAHRGSSHRESLVENGLLRINNPL